MCKGPAKSAILESRKLRIWKCGGYSRFCSVPSPGSQPVVAGTGNYFAFIRNPSTLAWKIPWTEEPGRLWSMGSLRVGHDWATSLSCTEEGNGNPLQCSCLENPRDGGAWWAAVYGVAQSRTRLTWLSSSSSSRNPRCRSPLLGWGLAHTQPG